jgi:RNA polymerase sigma-70 factor (ECF subfamily)
MRGYDKIIPEILNGDTDLYREIVAEYKNKVFAVVYSMIRDYHTAEDLTQDVFIEGYIKLNSLADYDKLGTWLTKIAKNKCCNYLGREAVKHKRECELGEYIPDMLSQTPENYMIDQYETENVEKAVQKLPELQKTVIILFYFENYPQKKIAEALNIPEGTVKRRLYDARLNLKKELDRMNTFNETEDINAKLKNDEEFEKRVMGVINSILSKIHDENFLQIIDEEIEKTGTNKNALGMLYFWRGASQMMSKDKALNGAKRDLEKAFEYLNGDNKYKASALSGIKMCEVLEKDREQYVTEVKMSSAGEVWKEYNGKVDWLGNPGFNQNFFKCPQTNYYQIFLWASRICKEVKPDSFMRLFDLSMSVGDTVTEESSGNSMTLVSKDETVTVLCGTFENCMHINIKYNGSIRDVWYAKDTGLIKFTDNGGANDGIPVNYELFKYKINGGKGYIPAAVGNLWNYKSTTLDEEKYYQFNEYEVVSVTEKLDGKYINVAASNCFKLRKDAE